MYLSGALIMVYNVARTLALPASERANHPAVAMPAQLALAGE